MSRKYLVLSLIFISLFIGVIGCGQKNAAGPVDPSGNGSKALPDVPHTPTPVPTPANANVHVSVMHNSVVYVGVSVTAVDSLGSKYFGVTNLNGNAVFVLRTLGNFKIQIASDANGIALTEKTGTIGSGESKTISFTGQNGSLAVSNGNFLYPYLGGNNAVVITYTNAGDINYKLALDCLNYATVAGISKTFTPDQSISKNLNTCTMTEIIGPGKIFTNASLAITGSKPGQNSFQIQSGNFSLQKNWTLSIVQLEPAEPVGSNNTVQMQEINRYSVPNVWGGGYVDYIDRSAGVNITLLGTNMPSSATVNVAVSYSMPSGHYDHVTVADAPFSAFTDTLYKRWLTGFKFQLGNPNYGIALQQNGTITATVTAGDFTTNKTLPLYY